MTNRERAERIFRFTAGIIPETAQGRDLMVGRIERELDAAVAEAMAKDTEIARLREALAHIATLHVNYADPANNGPDFSNEYSIGITDGLRCAAKFARAALERKHG